MDSSFGICGVPAYEADELDRKIIEHFPGKIVRKDLTSLMKRSAGIPTYVLEYLLGMYCATDDEAAIADGMARIRKILAENYVRPEESEKIKSRIRELGQYTVIDKVSARLDEYRDLYIAQFTNLNIEPFVMPDEYVRQHTKILTGGIWCIMRIQYLRPEDIAEDPLADIFGDDPAEQRGRAGVQRANLGQGQARARGFPFQNRKPHPHPDAQPRPVRVCEPSRGVQHRRVDCAAAPLGRI